MVYGIKRCSDCGFFYSEEEKIYHICNAGPSFSLYRVEYLRCIFDELFNNSVKLPMGDYNLVNDLLDDIQYDLELLDIQAERKE